MFRYLSRLPMSVILGTVVVVLYCAASITAGFMVHDLIREVALNDARERAEILLERNLATHGYLNTVMKPAVFAMQEHHDDIDFDPRWMSSTYAVRAIDDAYRTRSGSDYYYKECAMDARSPVNEADAVEADFLRRANADDALHTEDGIREIDGRHFYVVMHRGETMQEGCLRCHSTPEAAPAGLVEFYGGERSFNRSAGDLVSAVSIRIPLESAFINADRMGVRTTGSLLVVMLFILVVHLGIQRVLITRPLANLRDTARDISRNAERLGEELPPAPGREVNELVGAFNSLSVRLRQNHDRLEDTVRVRTAELAEANVLLEADIRRRELAEEELRTANEELAAYAEMMDDKVSRELEKRRSQETMLMQQSRMATMGTMLSIIAHQWKQPLNVLSIGLQTVGEIVDDDEIDRQAVHSCIDQGLSQITYMARTADDFQSLVRASRQPEPFDVSDAARAAIDFTRPLYAKDSIEVSLSAPDDPVTADGYRNEFSHVVIALVSNARQAILDTGSTSGRIDLTISRTADAVVMTVADTGGGIPESVKQRLFEPFVTSRQAEGGTGIGLYLCRIVVEEYMGGRITADNEGEGALFTIVIPGN